MSGNDVGYFIPFTSSYNAHIKKEIRECLLLPDGLTDITCGFANKKSLEYLCLEITWYHELYGLTTTSNQNTPSWIILFHMI